MVLRKYEKKLAKASAVLKRDDLRAADSAAEKKAAIAAGLDPAAVVVSEVEKTEATDLHTAAAEIEAAIAVGLDLAAVAADSEAEMIEAAEDSAAEIDRHDRLETDHRVVDLETATGADDLLVIALKVADSVDAMIEAAEDSVEIDLRLAVIEAETIAVETEAGLVETDRHLVGIAVETEMVADVHLLVIETVVATDQAMAGTGRSLLAIDRSLHLAVARNEDLEVGE